MQITFKNTQHTGKIATNRKEKHFYQQYTVIDGEFNELVVARLYSTTNTTYACVWIHGSKVSLYVSGGGKAGGYGYHKASAAIGAALTDAGLTLSEDIDARGDSAIEEALLSIGRKLSTHAVKVFKAHA